MKNMKLKKKILKSSQNYSFIAPDNLSKIEKMGYYMKEVRENRVRISQEYLADKLGVTRQTVSKWERGVHAPDIMMLSDICRELRISIYELLDGEDKPKNYEPQNITEFTIKNMKFYVNNSVKKIIKYTSIIIIGIVLLFSAIIWLFNVYKWNLYKISGDENNYNVTGFVVTNKNESIYNFESISYVSKDINTAAEPLVLELKISIELDGKEIYSTEIYNDEPKPIHRCLDNIPISLKTSKDNIFDKNKKLIIYIKYLDNKKEFVTNSIDLVI